MLIRNNVDGYEKSVLERFEEPSWNNPVMRFLDGKGRDLLPRKDRLWRTEAVGARVAQALAASGKPLPSWVDTLAQECSSGEVETAVFAMF